MYTTLLPSLFLLFQNIKRQLKPFHQLGTFWNDLLSLTFGRTEQITNLFNARNIKSDPTLLRFESYELDGKEEPYNATKLLEFLEQQSSFDLFSTFDVVVKAGPGPMGASSNDVLPVYPYSILPTT